MISSKVVYDVEEIKQHLFGRCGVAQVGDTLFAVVNGELHQIEVPAGRELPLAQGDEPWEEGVHWNCGFGLLVYMYERGLLPEDDPQAAPFRALYEATGGHNPTFSAEEAAGVDALIEMLRDAAASGKLKLSVVRIQRRRRFYPWPEGRSGATSNDGEEE